MAAHVGRFVDEKRRSRAAAFHAGERARRAGIEHRDAHVGGNLIEAIAQRAIGIAIVAEQQALFVGVARVVDDDLGAARRGAGDAPRVGHASGQRVERVDELFQLRLPQHDLIGRRDAPRSTSTRANRSASAIAYCSCGRLAPPALAPTMSA